MKAHAVLLCRIFYLVLVIFSVGSDRASAQSTVVQRNYPGLTITGTTDQSYPIQYVETMANSNNWLTLTNLTLPASPYLFIDTSAPDVSQRYYRESNVTFTAENYVGLTISGNVGSTNMIQFVDLGGDTNNWSTLTSIVLASNPQFFVDTISPRGAHRRYRAEDLARPPLITSPTLALAQVGVPFNYTITASSYLPITSYDAAGLPSGLSVDTSSGLISGTPTAVGTNTITLSANNATGPGSATLTLSLRLSLATELVPVPAGTFTLGSPADEVGRDDDESPQTQVTISHGFFVGKYEVSQAEYQAVVGSNPSFARGDVNRPVEVVSWQDATNFCALLTARDRQAGRISGSATYRLPTEAEWEYAARAGTSTSYSFGDDGANLGPYAWYSGNSGSTTHPIGQKLANPWGLYDVYGNVWELCTDWYGTYPGGAVTDPQGPATGSTKAIRGGSWFFGSSSCRSANRMGVSPTGRYTDLGFRIVLSTQ